MSSRKLIIALAILLIGGGAVYAFVFAPSSVTKGTVTVGFGGGMGGSPAAATRPASPAADSARSAARAPAQRAAAQSSVNTATRGISAQSAATQQSQRIAPPVNRDTPQVLFDRLKGYSHVQLYQIQDRYEKTAWLVTQYACVTYTSTGLTLAQRQAYQQYLTNFGNARQRLMVLLDQGYARFAANRREIEDQISTLNVTAMFMGETISLIARNRPDCINVGLLREAFMGIYDDRQQGGHDYLAYINQMNTTFDQLVGR